jgi:predicted DNA-binding transcriptional regulator YafY
MMMQVERQWKLLRLIPDKRNRRSTDELWNALRSEVEYDDISKRTVERDLAFLQTMFPLEQKTEGRTNYWYWQPNINMWLPGMTDEEALAFHMVERNMSDLLPEVSMDRLASYFAAARARLTEKPKGVRPWTGKFRIISSGVPRVARKRINLEPSRVVRQALLEDRQLVVSYFDKAAIANNTLQTVDLTVNPLAIVQRDKELLLVFSRRSELNPEYIALRDIEKATVSLDQFDGPSRFDVDAYIESGALHGSTDLPLPIGLWIRLSVSLDEDEWQRVCNSPLVASERISHDKNGRTRLLMPIRFTAELAEWLLGLGPKVKVHQPSELRQWIAHKTRSAANQYRGDSTAEKPQHVFRWFDRWEEATLACSVCNWEGQANAKEMEPDDSTMHTGTEFRCPSCSQLLLAVDYSATMDEIVAHWDVLDRNTRAAVLCTPERMELFERDKLRSPKDLPDLKKGPNFLTWHLVRHKEGEVSNSLRHGGRLLWIQLALWDGVDEFLRVAEILRIRYGQSINRIHVSPEAMGFLGVWDVFNAKRIEMACRMERVTPDEE